jgi:hypothetical protein
LIQWRRNKGPSSSFPIPPELDGECLKLRDDDHGILNVDIIPMAKRLGLRAIPPMSPTLEGLEHWLRMYGPLWVNGKTHIVVIAGIDTFQLKVKVYDPDPNIKAAEWRPLEGWYAFGSSPSTRDIGKDVEAVFLFVPN